MALGITLIVAALLGLFFGIKKKNKILTVISIVALILIAIIYIGYLYLYSLTPY